MEIKRIDRKRIKEKKEEEAEIAKAAARIARLKKEEQERKSKKIPKSRVAMYIVVAMLLIGASIAYNFAFLAKAKKPIEIESTTSFHTVKMEFQEMCTDLEDYMLENEEYPESIEEWSFSEYLSYTRRNGKRSFYLEYDDGRVSMSYDSLKDFETLR